MMMIFLAVVVWRGWWGQGFLPGAKLSVVVSMIGMEGLYVALRALKDRIYSTVLSTRDSFENSTLTNGQHS